MRRATFACLLAAACGSTSESPNQIPDAAVSNGADAAVSATVDAAVGEGMVTLAEYSWTLPKGTERYYCVRKTVTQDMYINRFEPIIPTGTHHTVMTVGAPGPPDGVTECTSLVTEPHMIYASGVATPAMDLPAGVAMKVKKGEQLLLNLHLFNVSDAPLSGRSGVRARLLPAGEVVHEAEAILAGTLDLDIRQGISTQTGNCTISGPTTIFAVGPHMHQLGIHQKVAVVGGNTLLDRDYSFDEQTFQLVDAPLNAGQTIRVDCTYDNPNKEPVIWGESSKAEMCFAILFRYPSSGGGFPLCTD